MDKLDQMRRIAAKLNEASEAYYGGRDELMSDFEWDALFDELKALETETGTILPESPTAKVSGAKEEGQREQHEFPALSLAKTKSVNDVAKWAGGKEIWLSWKLDGLTLVATYDNGLLTRLLTRGDGQSGLNITRLASAIKALPRNIDFPGHLVVRGEAVITYADFNAFAQSSKEDYANPRNLASGSLTLKDLDEVARRNIRFVAFTLVHGYTGDWGERMAKLDSLGFQTVERELLQDTGASAVQNAIDRWTLKVTGGECPFPVDGLVATYNDTEYAAGGSVTRHHAERAGLAFKWQDESRDTRLVEIEWNCAINCIAPVAVFEPVELEGTIVRRATLHNVGECIRLGIGGKGSLVSVIKANKIIPKIVAVKEKVGEFAIPEKCPVCSSPAKIESLAGSASEKLVCTNPHCPAKELRKFIRFVSKSGMDIDGLAGETLAKFINAGFIKTYADIFRLAVHELEIAMMDGFGTKSAANILKAVESARRRPAANMLNALSIPQCGSEVAKRLLRAAGGSLRALLDAADAPDAIERLSAIDDIGPVIAGSFVAWWKDAANRAVLEDLLTETTPVDEVAEVKDGQYAGMTFVVTGDVHRFKNRAELKAYIEARGGKVTNAVTKATACLINNDSTSRSGKNRKAQELGIPVVTEEEFLSGAVV